MTKVDPRAVRVGLKVNLYWVVSKLKQVAWQEKTYLFSTVFAHVYNMFYAVLTKITNNYVQNNKRLWMLF